jgi:hypothetical protein
MHQNEIRLYNIVRLCFGEKEVADLEYEFIVEENKKFFLQNIFIGDYGKFNSPLLPIYILSDDPELGMSKYIEKSANTNFHVVESDEDLDEGYRIIGFILMRYWSENEILVVFKTFLEGKNKWNQVGKLEKSILTFLYDHGYKIITASPYNIIPFKMYSPKKVAEELKISISKVPPLKGILETEEKVDQSDLEGSESSSLPLDVPFNLETNILDLSLINDADDSASFFL